VSSECRGASIKGCGCTANIKAIVHPEYAKEMNVGSPKPHNDKEKAHDTYSTAVDVYIQPDYTGHDPAEDRDVNLLSMDHRVRDKIQDLAKSQNLDASYIKTEVYAFSEKLVANLGIGQNSSQFFERRTFFPILVPSKGS